jgi:hypothetical protein
MLSQLRNAPYRKRKANSDYSGSALIGRLLAKHEGGRAKHLLFYFNSPRIGLSRANKG